MISSNFVAINSDRATMIFCQLYFIMIKIFLKNQCINWIRQFHPPGVLKCIYVIGAIVVPSSVLWVMPAAQTHMFHWWKFCLLHFLGILCPIILFKEVKCAFSFALLFIYAVLFRSTTSLHSINVVIICYMLSPAHS